MISSETFSPADAFVLPPTFFFWEGPVVIVMYYTYIRII